MNRKPQPASVTAVTSTSPAYAEVNGVRAVTAQTPLPQTSALNPETGMWEPLRPIGLQGPLGRLEQALIDRKHLRLARIVGWIDEAPLRWPFVR